MARKSTRPSTAVVLTSFPPFARRQVTALLSRSRGPPGLPLGLRRTMRTWQDLGNHHLGCKQSRPTKECDFDCNYLILWIPLWIGFRIYELSSIIKQSKRVITLEDLCVYMFVFVPDTFFFVNLCCDVYDQQKHVTARNKNVYRYMPTSCGKGHWAE